MAVYVIISYDIDDLRAYRPYIPGITRHLRKHGAEMVVADYDAKSIEGQVRGVNIVLRFESEEAATNCYDDPNYVPLKKIRLASTSNGTILMAKQFAHI